ncbi:MAG: hypothetical protein ACE14P_09705 [Methanotrichaceae archaeon]
MYNITYDLWNDIIDDCIEAHGPLFEAMRRTADKIRLSKAELDELKQKGVKDIYNESWSFLLKIELYDDQIEGFAITLLAAETLEVFDQIKIIATLARGVSEEELSSFEAEHGLDIDEEIFKGMNEGFDIAAEAAENGVLFELIVFDSEDIDNSSSIDRW